MDTLSEVLRAIRLTGAVYFTIDGSSPWVVETPRGAVIAPHIGGGVEHVVNYRVITSGGGTNLVRIATLIASTTVGANVTAADAATPPPSGKQRLYLDVHELGPGKVNAGAVADAHRKDLATQARHGVHYRAYWVDEKKGRIYCLVDAPSADAAMAVHREAHGLVANKVQEVTGHSDQWAPAPGMKLYLDHHALGPGKVTAKDVAAAHRKDLAVQAKHKARFLNYWFDEATGTVTCLVEAPTAEDAVAAHKEAHGLVPETIDEVVEGR